MSYFEDEHVSRSFRCEWRPRRDDAGSIARRIQHMAWALGEIAEDLSRLWPQFEMRAMRPDDPGPVLELAPADLGQLIDSRCRFDPPYLPAPCGPRGYSIVLVGNVLPLKPRQTVGFNIHAGSIEDDFENDVRLTLYNGSEIWRDIGAGVRILDALTGSWDADWGLAAGSVYDRATDQMGSRPWLKWVREGVEPRNRVLSAIESAGQRTRHGEGELIIWP